MNFLEEAREVRKNRRESVMNFSRSWFSMQDHVQRLKRGESMILWEPSRRVGGKDVAFVSCSRDALSGLSHEKRQDFAIDEYE